MSTAPHFSGGSVERFTPAHPCPVCGGHERLPRGKGIRCAGFLSSDGRFAHCSREEHAGGLDAEQSGTYAHVLRGPCRCGVTHGEREPGNGADRSGGFHIAATYDYRDESGELLYQTVRLEPKDFRQRRPDGAGGWEWNVKGVRRVLYRLHELLAALSAGDTVYVVEGEKDADRLHAEGHVATCNVGGAGKWRLEYAEVFRGTTSEVRIVADRDETGRRHAREVAASLSSVGVSARILEPPVAKDVSDHLDAGRTLEEFVHLLEDDSLEIGNSAGPDSRPTTSSPILVELESVTSERVRWLWPGRIPLGKVTVVDGDPGLGKSTLLLDLAARVSTGRPMPDGAPGVHGGVVLLSAEDGLADTIRPRLEAAGADLSLIVAFQGVRQRDGGERLPELPSDLPALKAAMEKVGAVLVVVDPVMAFLGGEVNAHRDQDVRRALAPLARIAERTGAAIVVLRHLNKSLGSSAIYRGGGSIGIVGAARSALLVAKDPDDEERRVLAPVKSNLCATPGSLAFRVVGAENGAAAIDWQGISGHSATALLATPADGPERNSADEARDFLRDFLRGGARTAKEANRAARGAGISKHRLERARQSLGIRPQRQGFGPGAQYLWELPSDHAPHHVPHAPQSPESAEHAEHDAEHGENRVSDADELQSRDGEAGA